MNGSKKDGNVSLFVRIIKGVNDEELEWPCQMKITMEAMEHTGKNKKYTTDFGKCTNVKHTRRPGHNGSGEISSGKGSSNFIAHTEINDFINKYQLTIKCYLATDN